MTTPNKRKFNPTTEISLEKAGIQNWQSTLPKSEDELMISISCAATEHSEAGKSAFYHPFRRRPVISENFKLDLDQFIGALATDKAKETLKAVGVTEIFEAASKSFGKPTGNSLQYCHVDQYTVKTSALWLIEHNANSTHANDAVFNFADITAAYCRLDSAFNSGDVTCIRLPVDRVDGTNTSEYVVVIKSKVPGMFLMLAVGQDAEGHIKSVRPALGFDIRKEV